jgi:hypothetical protein
MSPIFVLLYRVSLFAFPHRLRKVYGLEMIDVYTEKLAAGFSVSGAFAEIGDVLLSGLRARLRYARFNTAWLGGLATAVIVAVVVLHERTVIPTIDFNAHDPAGQFTLSIRRGVPVAASIDRVPIPRDRITASGDSIHLLSAQGAVLLAVAYHRDRERIEWEPRTPK